jgi:hypothetical protein
MTAGFIPPAHWGETASQLRKSGQVTLNAAGLGVLTFETDNSNQRWVITQVVVNTNQPAAAITVPQCTLALNTTDISQLSQGNTRGTTYSGNNDTFSASVDVGPMDYASLLFFPPPGSTAAQVTALAGVIAGATVQGVKYTRRS